MNEQHLYHLIPDSEFERLCPIPTMQEYINMEEEIASRGCPRPIQVWHKTILYDYIYYEICHKWEVPFQIEELNFKNRDEATFFICKKILETPNLSDVYHHYLIGKCFLAMKKIMSEVFSGKRKCPFPTPDCEPLSKTNHSQTAKFASQIFHLAPGTVSQYGSYAKALDFILEKNPEIAYDIFKKEIRLSIRNTITLSKMPLNEITVAYNHIKNCEKSSLLHSETKCKPVLENVTPNALPKRKRKIIGPEIKQMPKYDPDAEISSLTLTIPTWVSSMKRTLSIANFHQASTEALWKLEQKLNDLKIAIEILQDAVEEEYHE